MGLFLGDVTSTTPPSFRPYSAAKPAVITRMDSTSLDSIGGAKPGERFSVSGRPATTNWTSYSEPRGCKTPLASCSQPGWASTTSMTPRPTCGESCSPIVCEPIVYTVVVRDGSTKVSVSLTCSWVSIGFNPSVKDRCWGTMDRISTSCTAGTNPECDTLTR